MDEGAGAELDTCRRCREGDLRKGSNIMANKKLTKAEAEERKAHFVQVIKNHMEDTATKAAGLQTESRYGKYKTRVFTTDKAGVIRNITQYVAIVGELRLSKDGGDILTNYNPDNFLEGVFAGIFGGVKVYRII